MNYGELKQEVADYMHRIDLGAQIPGFIEKARVRINRDLRVREMLIEKQVTPTVNPFPVESDFLEMRGIYHSQGAGNRISLTLTTRLQLNRFAGNNIAQSNPQFYSIDGLQIETAPGGISIVFTEIYYAAEAELVADSDTNTTLDVYPTIWLYAALIEGHSFTQDLDLMQSVQSFYTSEVEQANSQAAASESGAALEMSGASSFF